MSLYVNLILCWQSCVLINSSIPSPVIADCLGYLFLISYSRVAGHHVSIIHLMKFNNHKTIATLVQLFTETNYVHGNSEEQSFYHRLQALKGEDLTLQSVC